MAIQTPRRFKNRHGIYGVRFVVPLHARTALGKKEIRLSLRARCPDLSRQLALQFNLEIERAVSMSKLPSPSNTIQVNWTIGPDGAVWAEPGEDTASLMKFFEASPELGRALVTRLAGGSPTAALAIAPKALPNAPAQLDQLIAGYFEHSEWADKNDAKTIDEKRRALADFCRFLDEEHELASTAMAHNVGRMMVVGYVRGYSKRPGKHGAGGVSGGTIAKVKGHLRGFFAFALRAEAITTNPSETLDDEFTGMVRHAAAERVARVARAYGVDRRSTCDSARSESRYVSNTGYL